MNDLRTGGDDLGTVGERLVLSRIIPRLPQARAALLGPGDDGAVLAADDSRVVVTTDLLIEGPDFRLAWTGPWELGWKSAAVNLADVTAMGAGPTGLVVAIAVPASTSVDWLEAFADGMREACEQLAPGCGVVGGDLSHSPLVTVAVSAFGDLHGRPPVLRSGARAGDIVGYAGRLGLAAAGLRALFDGAIVDGEADRRQAAALLARRPGAFDDQLTPVPPVALGPKAAKAGATAMLDVSDGLVLDGTRLAEASGVVLNLSSMQLAEDFESVAEVFPEYAEAAAELVLAGGEDHGLLATFPSRSVLPAGFRQIGRVLAGAPEVQIDGEKYRGRGGWDPFDPR